MDEPDDSFDTADGGGGGGGAVAPPPPPPPAGDLPRPPAWRLALPVVAVVAVVLAVGALAGLAAFRVRGPHTITHDVRVTLTLTGWKVAGIYTHDPSEPAVGGSHVAWWCGSSLFLLDALTGHVSLLQGALDTEAYSRPVASSDYVVWIAVPRIQDGSVDAPGRLLVYDLREGRRREIAIPGGGYGGLSVSGEVALWSWADLAGGHEVRGADLASGRLFTVARDAPAKTAIAGDGDVAAWGEGGPGTFPDHLVVTRLDGDTRRTIALPPDGGERTFGGPVLHGDTILWSVYDAGDDRGSVWACGLDGGDRRRLVDLTPGWAPWALAGDNVLSAVVDAGVPQWRLMTTPLTGGSSRALLLATGESPSELTASDGAAAWIATRPGTRRWLEVTRLPR